VPAVSRRARLKKHSWRYHKKYLTSWFQRHAEPMRRSQQLVTLIIEARPVRVERALLLQMQTCILTNTPAFGLALVMNAVALELSLAASAVSGEQHPPRRKDIAPMLLRVDYLLSLPIGVKCADRLVAHTPPRKVDGGAIVSGTYEQMFDVHSQSSDAHNTSSLSAKCGVVAGATPHLPPAKHGTPCRTCWPTHCRDMRGPKCAPLRCVRAAPQLLKTIGAHAPRASAVVHASIARAFKISAAHIDAVSLPMCVCIVRLTGPPSPSPAIALTCTAPHPDDVAGGRALTSTTHRS
jgi:hypothetical protein